jgi:3-isopropylmalate/(R)-2-methylmalate dehydratase small subunit
MEKFTPFESWVAVLPVDNIDTDQIIPARFLKTISKIGLGDQLFFDWRYLANGEPNPEFVINRAPGKSAQILLAGDNFGCGSSREHAPWALTQFGFRAVVSTSFADIFKGNALKNGLVPVVISREAHAKALAALANDPLSTASVDLAAQTITLPGAGTVTFPIDAFSKTCLIEGVDEMGFLLKHEAEIADYEKDRAMSFSTKA